jgi:hypothetical protein
MTERDIFNKNSISGNLDAVKAKDIPEAWNITIRHYKRLAKHYRDINMSFEADLFEEGVEKLRRNLKQPKKETNKKGTSQT